MRTDLPKLKAAGRLGRFNGNKVREPGMAGRKKPSANAKGRPAHPHAAFPTVLGTGPQLQSPFARSPDENVKPNIALPG
ncbi:MAG: hypothetical protein AAGA12_03915 [Pseudomonadota bacterium]